jgi:hypothetical protein
MKKKELLSNTREDNNAARMIVVSDVIHCRIVVSCNHQVVICNYGRKKSKFLPALLFCYTTKCLNKLTSNSNKVLHVQNISISLNPKSKE